MKNYSFEDILTKIQGLEEVRDFCTNERTLSDYELLEYTVKLIERRMNHCSAKLLANLKNAKREHDNGVYWKGGHFSIPTYEVMDKFVKHPTIEGIGYQIAEQAWKQLTLSFNCSADVKYQLTHCYADFMCHSMWEQIQEAYKGLNRPSGLVRKNKK